LGANSDADIIGIGDERLLAETVTRIRFDLHGTIVKPAEAASQGSPPDYEGAQWASPAGAVPAARQALSSGHARHAKGRRISRPPLLLGGTKSPRVISPARTSRGTQIFSHRRLRRLRIS
jgi:hypothetical protein